MFIRRKATQEWIIRWVNVKTDGRDDDGLSTYHKIGTFTVEQSFVSEVGLPSFDIVEWSLLMVVESKEASSKSKDIDSEAALVFFWWGKFRKFFWKSLDWQKPAGTSKVSRHLVLTCK